MDLKRLSVEDASPGRGPYRKPWIDSPVVRFIAAALAAALCAAIFIVAGVRP